MAFPSFDEGPESARPTINHDHGFLDDGKGAIDPSKFRDATWEDYKLLAYWTAKLNGAEVLRPDLKDGTKGYRRFLDKSGADLLVTYESYIAEDASGKTTLKSLVEDTTASAIAIHDKKIAVPPAAAREDSFSIVSESIAARTGSARYPYPAVENWQKAIGAHYLWVNAAVKVGIDPAAKKRAFEVRMVVHVEDMYNFNPNNADIATGTKDEENGRFEVTGLAKEFLSKATITRVLRFTTTLAPVPDSRVAPADLDVSGR